jgi:hypothetical protein
MNFLPATERENENNASGLHQDCKTYLPDSRRSDYERHGIGLTSEGLCGAHPDPHECDP